MLPLKYNLLQDEIQHVKQSYDSQQCKTYAMIYFEEFDLLKRTVI